MKFFMNDGRSGQPWKQLPNFCDGIREGALEKLFRNDALWDAVYESASK